MKLKITCLVAIAIMISSLLNATPNITFNKDTLSAETINCNDTIKKSLYLENNGSLKTTYNLLGRKSSGIHITEAFIGNPDHLEIMNTSNRATDINNWKIIISADYSSIDLYNSSTYTLSGTLAPGEILWWTDESADINYFGSNMYWSSANPGWVMLLDEWNQVRDFVAWGWSQSHIYSMSFNFLSTTITIDSENWIGDGIVSACSFSFNRIGNTDNDNSDDFLCNTSSGGSLNSGLSSTFSTKYIPSWLSFNKTQDSILPGEKDTIEVTYYGQNAIYGEQYSNILFTLSDTLDVSDSVIFGFVKNGLPDLTLSDTLIGFDTLMIYDYDTASFYICNPGCDTLTIDSLKISGSMLTIPTYSQSVFPGDSAYLDLILNGSTLGAIDDTVTIYTNAGDSLILVKGTVMDAPSLAVDMDTMNVVLNGCSDSLISELVLYNKGGIDLNYSILNLFFDSTSIENFYTAGSSTYHVFNTIPANPDSLIVNVTINGDYNSTTEYATLYIEGQSIGQLDGGGTYTDYEYTYAFTGIDQLGWLDDGVLDIQVVNSASVNTGYGDDVHIVNIVNAKNKGHKGVKCDTNGTIAGNDSATISILFCSNNLLDGLHNTSLSINTNDPVHPTYKVFTNIQVNGEPIMITPDSITFGKMFLNTTVTDSLYISNIGCDTLVIDSLRSSNPALSVSSNEIEALPGDSIIISVSMQPTMIGEFDETFTVYTNVGDSLIKVSTTVMDKPTITIKDTIPAILNGCSDSLFTSFMIYNTGGSALDYSVSGGGTLQPYDSTSLQYFTNGGGSTMHSFSGLSSLYDTLILTITLNGDFDFSSEYADLYIEGTYIDRLDGGATNTDIDYTFTYTDSNVVNWLADEILNVNIFNSADVNAGFGDATHKVKVVGIGGSTIYCDSSGTVAVDDSAGINVLLTSNGLNDGIHNMPIYIKTNDPVNPNHKVVFNLTVNGLPAIVVRDSVAFDTIPEEYTISDTILIYNTGCADLTISSIGYDNNEFNWYLASSNVLPSDATELIVTYDPDDMGTDECTLTINNNDTIKYITLTGTADIGPKIQIPESEFGMKINDCSSNDSVSLVINSIGSDTLKYSLISYENPLVITEVFLGTTDFIEITNKSNNTIDVSNYSVLVSSSYTRADTSNSLTWNLSGTMAAGEVRYRDDDDLSSNYWGSNIYWNSSENGWAMIVDKKGNVIDFIGWGWTQSSIYGINFVLGTLSINVDQNDWSGDGVSSICTSSLTRNGSADNNDNSDFTCTTSTQGSLNTGLSVPFMDVNVANMNFSKTKGSVAKDESDTVNIFLKSNYLTAGIDTNFIIIQSNDPQTYDTVLVIVDVADISCANFSYNINQNTGLVNFTDISSNNPASWNWSFGDGNTSALQNPSHTYTDNGTYDVTLEVCNGNGCDQITQSITITSIDNVFNLCSDAGSNLLKGTIYDSGGEFGDYGNYEDCSFLIDIPSADYIDIKFTLLDTEADKDVINVYNGNSTSSPKLLSRSGLLDTFMLSTPSNKALITFQTDSVNVSNGFKIEWLGIEPSGIEFVDKDYPNINTYPNPSNGKFVLEINNLHCDDCNLAIYDILGNKVASESFSVVKNLHKEMDLGGMPQGIYILKLNTNNSLFKESIIIE